MAITWDLPAFSFLNPKQICICSKDGNYLSSSSMHVQLVWMLPTTASHSYFQTVFRCKLMCNALDGSWPSPACCLKWSDAVCFRIPTERQEITSNVEEEVLHSHLGLVLALIFLFVDPPSFLHLFFLFVDSPSDPEHPKVNNDKRPKFPRWTRVELHDEFCSTAHLSQDSGEQRHRTSPCTLSLPRRSRSSIGVGWERRQRRLEEYLGDDFRTVAGRCLEGTRRSKGQFGLKSFSSTPSVSQCKIFYHYPHIYRC